MTWYYKDKFGLEHEVDYDYNGEKGPSDIWDTLIEIHGNKVDALTELIREELDYGFCQALIKELLKIQDDPEQADGIDLQGLLDDFIWNTTTLLSDSTMFDMDEKDRHLTVGGIKFYWRDD